MSPDNRHLNSYRQPDNLWSFIQTKNSFLKDNQGTFSFWEGRGRMEKGEEKNRKEKSIYNPVVHPKFLSLCTGGSTPPFQSARASQSAQAVGLSEEQQLGLCPPRSLSFSLKWQQWAYPVQGQCWSSWDVGCYSKTCTRGWVQRAAGWELEPSGYNNWSRIRSHNSCNGASCWRARRRCRTHSSGQPGGQGANGSSLHPQSPR